MNKNNFKLKKKLIKFYEIESYVNFDQSYVVLIEANR